MGREGGTLGRKGRRVIYKKWGERNGGEEVKRGEKKRDRREEGRGRKKENGGCMS